MAYFTVHAESNGKPINAADVTVFDEKPAVAKGSESSNFAAGDKASIFSDHQLSVAELNPGKTDVFGDFTFHVESLTLMAILVAKTSIGQRWYRFQEATGSDILG